MARRSPKRRSSKTRRARRGKMWQWLGVGAAGAAGMAAAFYLGKRQRRLLGPARPIPALPPAELSETRQGPTPLPSDVAEAWLPGPGGALRILERHPDGGTAALFVHGLGGRAELWSEQLAAAGPGLRAIAIDLPGHGESDPTETLQLADLAAAIGAVIDGLGLRRAVLVAHSLGAFAALDYAASHSERIAGLFMIDPSGDQSRDAADQRQRLLESLGEDPHSEMEWYFRQTLSEASAGVADMVIEALRTTDSETLLATFASGLSYDPQPALERFAGPVWSLVSDFNTLPGSLHNLDPDIVVRHLRGTSHWLMLDRPDKLQEHFLDFLDAAEMAVLRASRVPVSASVH